MTFCTDRQNINRLLKDYKINRHRHPVLTGKVKDVVYEHIHYVADQRGFLFDHLLCNFTGGTCKCFKTQTARKHESCMAKPF